MDRESPMNDREGVYRLTMSLENGVAGSRQKSSRHTCTYYAGRLKQINVSYSKATPHTTDEQLNMHGRYIVYRCIHTVRRFQ